MVTFPLQQLPIQGRGAISNPKNRFESTHYERIDEEVEEVPPQTQLIADSSRTIIAHNDSPDVGFDCSINPYRGCSHGCVYCYARPTHEYLGLSAGLDFETKILVKYDAAKLLREQLYAKNWKPQTIALSGVTDCYQPIERKLQLTRQCLQVLNEFRNPGTIITKNALLARDIDVLKEMAAWGGVRVTLSITTLRAELTRVMEPQTSVPARRLWAIEQLAKAGIPVGVMVAPVVPGLTDHEMLPILKAASECGASFAGYVVLRLPHITKELMATFLEQHFPDRREKVLNRVKDLRGGKLYNSNWGERQRGEGEFADQFSQMFALGCERYKLGGRWESLNKEAFCPPLRANEQMKLF